VRRKPPAKFFKGILLTLRFMNRPNLFHEIQLSKVRNAYLSREDRACKPCLGFPGLQQRSTKEGFIENDCLSDLHMICVGNRPLQNADRLLDE
jgi:hypothetical protein